MPGPPQSEVGRRRGAPGWGPFPSASSRTVLVGFPTHGSPVISCGWCAGSSCVDVLVAGATDHERLAASFCHEVDPGGPVGPIGPVEVGELADVVDLNVRPGVAELAASGEEPSD